MGSYLNPGNEAFAVALNSEIYVDKTGLLTYTNKVMNTLQGYICNSRPRRFGKSITANMLTAYYSKGCSSKEMFSGLEISRAKDFEKHLNQYDVLHWDIQWCMEPAGGPERIVSYISEKTISELKEYYPHILPEEIRSLPEALSRINAASGTKFIVIIDEWDVLIRDEAADLKTQEEYINFLRAMFKGTEPTKYIQLAYLTGILPVKKEKTQSALNNFKDYSMLYAGPIAPYVGFTETEVQKLCEVYGQKFEEVKRWYDGYQIGKYHVYNPNAVVNLMLEGEFQSYWSGTASYEAIVPLINMDFDGLKSAVIEMLSGDHVPVDVTSFQNDTVSFANKDDVLTYLIHLGYLAYDRTFRTAFIPNEEIRQELILATATSVFIMFGSCGSLDKEATDGKFILPTEAYLGEGLSYYFAEPQDYIKIKKHRQTGGIFQERNLPYVQGRVWTTDSMLRETVNLVNKRKEEGCIAVEMELAGVQAICDFYGFELYDFLIAGDVLIEGNYETDGLSAAVKI